MKQTTKDNVIYLSVSLVIAAAGIFYAFYVEKTTGKFQTVPGPILWGILSTPGIAALILEHFWKYRHRAVLWVILFVVVAMNLLAVFITYSRGLDPPVLLWSTITGLWVVVIFIVAEKLLLPKRGS